MWKASSSSSSTSTTTTTTALSWHRESGYWQFYGPQTWSHWIFNAHWLVGHAHGSLDRIFSRLIVFAWSDMTLTELDVFLSRLERFCHRNHHESYDWTYGEPDGVPAPQQRQCTPFVLGPWDLGQVETSCANDHHNNRDRCNSNHCNYHVSPLLIHYCWWYHIFHHG